MLQSEQITRREARRDCSISRSNPPLKGPQICNPQLNGSQIYNPPMNGPYIYNPPLKEAWYNYWHRYSQKLMRRTACRFR